MNGESVNGTRNSVEALVADAGSEIGTALAAIGVGVNIISGLLEDERTDMTATGWQQTSRLLRELPDLRKLHELRRLCAVLSGDYVPGSDGGQMRAEAAAAAACECILSCADDPKTMCSLSGEWHVHPSEPCPVHPDAPGDR